MNVRLARLTAMTALLALTFALSPLSLRAQSPSPSPPPVRVKLGDSIADGSILKPYKNAWKIVYAFPGKEPFLMGTWSDEVSKVEINGRHLFKRTQVANYAKYNIISTTINVFDPKTMAPVYSEFKRSDTGESVRRDFEGAVVKYNRATSPDANHPKNGQVKMEQPIFDYHGGMYGLLLATFPLRDGFTATLPTLAEERDAFEWTTFKVGKQELVEAGPGKQVMAWPVEVDEADRDHSIFWLTKEAPYVIKLVNIIPKGKWVTVTISMI